MSTVATVEFSGWCLPPVHSHDKKALPSTPETADEASRFAQRGMPQPPVLACSLAALAVAAGIAEWRTRRLAHPAAWFGVCATFITWLGYRRRNQSVEIEVRLSLEVEKNRSRTRQLLASPQETQPDQCTNIVISPSDSPSEIVRLMSEHVGNLHYQVRVPE